MTIGSETIPEYSFGRVHVETHNLAAIGADHSGIQWLFSNLVKLLPSLYLGTFSGFLRPFVITSKKLLKHIQQDHLNDKISVSGVGPEGGNLQGEAAVQEVETQPGNQQRADAQIRGRKPLQVSLQDYLAPVFHIASFCFSTNRILWLLLLLLLLFLLLQYRLSIFKLTCKSSAEDVV